MNFVRCEQVIYTRVEGAYSPHMRSGFQTVYKSESLHPSIVSVIERHVQCFMPHHPDIIRHQFFSLGSGEVVLTNSVLIPTHSEIVDRNMRMGAFIAHCLVLSQSEFKKAEYNPFGILDSYDFLDNAEEMVRVLGQATGVAPIVTIEVQQPSGPLLTWKEEETHKLLSLALQAKRLNRKRQSVLLVGEENEVAGVLRTIFHLTPMRERLLCTFDTYIDHCSTQQNQYWALGTTRQQSSSSYIQVVLAELDLR
jgi:hypothetical protein